MKKIILSLSLVITVLFTYAQDSWKVYHNGKLLLSTSNENAKDNTITIAKSSLDKNGDFSLIYTADTVSKAWQRKFSLGDSIFAPVSNNNKLHINLSNRELKELLNNNDKAGIVTWLFPKDPALAAAIRFRKVHLCTLLLQ